MIAEIVITALMILAQPIPHYEYIGTQTISAYSYTEGENITANGNYPTPYKTVATTSTYPFGTRLYIEGIGEVVVEDRGGQLIESGQRIDLHIGNDDCSTFGLQQRKVYIVR